MAGRRKKPVSELEKEIKNPVTTIKELREIVSGIDPDNICVDYRDQFQQVCKLLGVKMEVKDTEMVLDIDRMVVDPDTPSDDLNPDDFSVKVFYKGTEIDPKEITVREVY